MKGYLTEEGLTTIELLLSLGLVLVLFTPFYLLLHAGIKSYQTVETRVNHQQNLRIAMEAIAWDLRRCTNLVDSAVTTKLDEQNLLLQTKDQDIIWYYLVGHDLRWAIKKRRDLRFQAHNPVAGGITELKFYYNKQPWSDSTQVTILIEGIDELGQTYRLSSTVALRVDS